MIRKVTKRRTSGHFLSRTAVFWMAKEWPVLVSHWLAHIQYYLAINTWHEKLKMFICSMYNYGALYPVLYEMTLKTDACRTPDIVRVQQAVQIDPTCLLVGDFWLFVPQTLTQIQYHSTMLVQVSLACHLTQLAGQIMRHWCAAILIHFVSGSWGLSRHLVPSVKCYILSIYLFFFAMSSDSSPPPLAPFDHRIVTPKPHQIATYYTINRDEVLGGWVKREPQVSSSDFFLFLSVWNTDAWTHHSSVMNLQRNVTSYKGET